MSALGGQKRSPDCPEKRLPIFPQQRTSRVRAATSENLHNSGPDRPSRASTSLSVYPLQSDFATIKRSAHSGTTAFALRSEKSAGTSNLPVCRSYLQRQPFTTPVCMGLRPLTSASPDRAIRR